MIQYKNNGIRQKAIKLLVNELQLFSQLITGYYGNSTTTRVKAELNCVRRRKNAHLIRIGVKIVWDNVHCRGCMVLGIVLQGRMTSERREREPAIEIIERTPKSLIIECVLMTSRPPCRRSKQYRVGHIGGVY